MSFFYRPQTIILTITHKFNANKKAHPPKVQNLSEDGLLLSKICFLCLKRAKIPLKGNKKRRIDTISCILFCVLIWWRCGDLNPGSSFYTRHLLHAYSVIKFSYRRSPTDGGFEEAENADLLTAVGKSVARSV